MTMTSMIMILCRRRWIIFSHLRIKTMPSFSLFGKRKAAQKRKVIKSGNERLKREKITIYPTPEQVNKLYELIEDFRKRTGVRINQQDLIRRLIDSADSKTVLP